MNHQKISNDPHEKSSSFTSRNEMNFGAKSDEINLNNEEELFENILVAKATNDSTPPILDANFQVKQSGLL